jgi:two-component system nitrate/nitrite response regulator NarL
MINILLADDHQMFLDGMKALLSDSEGITVVAQALNGREVMEQLDKTSIDLVILDINMPEMDGVETTIAMQQSHPNIKVLILSMYNEKEFIAKILKAGADGYILKNTGRKELESAIRVINGGGQFFGKAVTETLLESYRQPPTRSTSKFEVQLTRREKDVLREIVNEFTTSEIAEKLFISSHTVESHRKNLLSKLAVRNTAGLVKLAIQHSLLDDD